MINKHKLHEALEDKIIGVVNNIGVHLNEIIENPHLHAPLQFISGLGPHKAQKML